MFGFGFFVISELSNSYVKKRRFDHKVDKTLVNLIQFIVQIPTVYMI